MSELDDVHMPAIPRDVIESRLAQQERQAREPFRVAAIIGPRVPFELCRTVMAVTGETLLWSIEPAVESRLARAWAEDQSMTPESAINRYPFPAPTTDRLLNLQLSASWLATHSSTLAEGIGRLK